MYIANVAENRWHLRDFPIFAAHICRFCGWETKRASVNPESIISGLIKCPQCNRESELNLKILRRESVDMSNDK